MEKKNVILEKKKFEIWICGKEYYLKEVKNII